VLSLTILTSPHEVGVASRALLFVLVEAVHGDPVWVDFTAGGALDAEHIFEGGVGGVERAEVGYSGDNVSGNSGEWE